VALGQVFSENFGFPCQSTFHLILHNHLHYHPRLAQKARRGRSANSLTNQIIMKKWLMSTYIFLLLLSTAAHIFQRDLPDMPSLYLLRKRSALFGHVSFVTLPSDCRLVFIRSLCMTVTSTGISQGMVTSPS
jgi:hypothetical protein